MTRQAHAIGNGIPNEYVQAIETVKELEAFAAVIYSSNFELEAVGEIGAEQTRVGVEGREGEKGREIERDRGPGAAVLNKATGLFENVREKLIGRA